jgi:hypothetical protein
VFIQNMVETEHKLHQGHVSDLYRDAEVYRLIRHPLAGERRAWLDLARSAAWAVAKLGAAGTLLRQRFVSPCGQFTLWRAQPDC